MGVVWNVRSYHFPGDNDDDGDADDAADDGSVMMMQCYDHYIIRYICS